MKVIIDTNFLLLPGNLHIDIFQGILDAADDAIELIILQNVVDELQDLSTRESLSLKDRKSAGIGLSLIKQKNLKIEHGSNEHTDNVILMKALEFKKQGISSAIATIDKELISRALSSEVQVFALRQKKKILLLK